jgi:hypothetical protein
MIMAVAWAWSGANRTPFLRRNAAMTMKAMRFVAVDERMVFS